MKRRISTTEIERFFNYLKEQPPIYDEEKVHQIINNPKAMARLKGKNTNLLKFTIMTTLFAIIISAILLWPGDNSKLHEKVSSINPYRHRDQDTRQVSDEKAGNTANSKFEIRNEVANEKSNKEIIYISQPEKDKVSPKKVENEATLSALTDTIDFKPVGYEAINESFGNVSKFEIDIYQTKAVKKEDDKKNMIWLSIKSKSTEKVSTGEYQYSSLNPNNRPSMTFSGGYFINTDSMLGIIGGRFILDTFPSDYAMQYELILENHQKITGKYQPKPYQKEEQNHSIEKQKQEFVYPDQILDSTLFIELNQQEFKELGFTFENQTMKLKFLVNEGNWFLNLIDSSAIFGVEFSDKPTHKAKEDKNNYVHMEANNFEMKTKNYDDATDYHYGITPMLVTNENGRRIFKLSMPEENLKNMFSKQFEKDFKTLLPVIMKRNTFGHQPKENFVFWFLPTDEFFNHLPKGISKELLKEYNYITAEDKSTLEKPECKYFDECKNTLAATGFKAYPNPASNHVTVLFTLPETIEGRITLVDLAGRERQVLQANTNFSSGSHQIDVDISNVPDGIYLLTLYSNKGIQTQRFIVAR